MVALNNTLFTATFIVPNGASNGVTNTLFSYHATMEPLPNKYKVRGIKLRDERARWRNR
jgi:hypothetical protein